jgi:hypothetical protein
LELLFLFHSKPCFVTRKSLRPWLGHISVRETGSKPDLRDAVVETGAAYRISHIAYRVLPASWINGGTLKMVDLWKLNFQKTRIGFSGSGRNRCALLFIFAVSPTAIRTILHFRPHFFPFLSP